MLLDYIITIVHAAMAQVVEHILGKDEVGSSSLPSSSKNKSTSSEVLLFLCLCPKGHNIVLR